MENPISRQPWSVVPVDVGSTTVLFCKSPLWIHFDQIHWIARKTVHKETFFEPWNVWGRLLRWCILHLFYQRPTNRTKFRSIAQEKQISFINCTFYDSSIHQQPTIQLWQPRTLCCTQEKSIKTANKRWKTWKNAKSCMFTWHAIPNREARTRNKPLSTQSNDTQSRKNGMVLAEERILIRIDPLARREHEYHYWPDGRHQMVSSFWVLLEATIKLIVES